MSRQVKRMKERKQLKQTKMKVLKFKVEEIKNVKETSNLMPPDWYNEKEGGYVYLWTNLTNLKLNEGVTDESELKPVYYLGLGSKGKLGYKDGTYYSSCNEKQYKLDQSNLNVEWKFEILDFYEEYEMAEYTESFKLVNVKAAQSPLYYNGNNGFVKIKESLTKDVIQLNADIEEASRYFMSLPIEKREGSYKGFRFKVEPWSVVESFIPYQLPEREEDTKVIDSVATKVRANLGNTSSISPILVMNLRDGIQLDDNGKYLQGNLNFAGNHRKKGCQNEGATHVNVLYVPDYRTANYGNIQIQQLAAADNPLPKEPKNPTGQNELVNIVVGMCQENNIPVSHEDIEDYLVSLNVDSKQRKKVKDLAKDKQKHQTNNTVPIKWNAKGWSAEAKRIVEALESDTSRAVVCSVETFNIEMLMRVWHEANENHTPITDFTYLMYGSNGPAWTMWDNEPKGRANADKLIDATRNEVYDKEGNLISEIKVHFRRLPGEHANVGVDYHNFWDSSRRGKTWLKDEGITLPKKDK